MSEREHGRAEGGGLIPSLKNETRCAGRGTDEEQAGRAACANQPAKRVPPLRYVVRPRPATWLVVSGACTCERKEATADEGREEKPMGGEQIEKIPYLDKQQKDADVNVGRAEADVRGSCPGARGCEDAADAMEMEH